MTLQKLIKDIFANGGDGKVADWFARSYIEIGDTFAKPFVPIKLDSLGDLRRMIEKSDQHFSLIDGEFFRFCAYFHYDYLFPVGRLYYVETRDIFNFAKLSKTLELEGLRFLPNAHSDLDHLISIAGFEDRISSYRNKRLDFSNRFEPLFSGRVDSTMTKHCYFFKSDGCLVCGSEIGTMITSTLGGTEPILIGCFLCSVHYDQASRSKSFLHFISEICGGVFPYGHMELGVEELFRLSQNFLPEILDVTVEKIEGRELHMIRKSGVRVIFRLTAIDDYAYVVLDCQKKEVSRIDSSDHHEVAWGPDHVHWNPRKPKNVESSFTTGYPIFDSRIVIQMIKKAES